MVIPTRPFMADEKHMHQQSDSRGDNLSGELEATICSICEGKLHLILGRSCHRSPSLEESLASSWQINLQTPTLNIGGEHTDFSRLLYTVPDFLIKGL